MKTGIGLDSLGERMQTISGLYSERKTRFEQEYHELQRTTQWFPWGRAATFLGGIFLVIWGWGGNGPRWVIWIGLVLFICFSMLVWLHRRFRKEMEDIELLIEVNQRGLHRLAQEWRNFPEDGHFFMPSPEHPYAHDIDLFGRGSLFQRINTTATTFGATTLSSWLLHRASIEEIYRRQALVGELQERMELLQHLEKEGRRLKADANIRGPEPFLLWVDSPSFLLNRKAWVWFARLFPLFTVGAFLFYQFRPISFLWWFVPLVVQVIVLGYWIRQIQPVLANVAYRERAFSLYSSLFTLIDSELTEPKQPLAVIQKQLRQQGSAPQKEMATIQRIVDLIEFRQSPLLHLPLNFFLLWDIHCLLFLEQWKERTRPYVRGWFDTLGDVEALSSLATCANEMPVAHFPTISEDTKPLFIAKELGHPLLDNDRRIYNDVSLDAKHSLLLITGSNMSGKSTLLRAMALNAVLAYAGGKVNAAHLRLSWMQIATSMRISDSLEQGVSYFMAELQRIKRVLDCREDNAPLLYLLDEILHGTNTTERRKAAFGVISLLQQSNSLGAVTTHDLELAEECKRFGERTHFAYFCDLIEEQQMVFDYKLREGICPTTNALRLMRMVGIPLVSVDQETEDDE